MSTILVIEDEVNIREVIGEMLRAENFTVIEAENAKQGTHYAKEIIPDLILCDVMMPDFDGYYVLSEVRSNPSTQITPFIFLTAKAAKEDMRLGMELGADDYITKPFTRDELMGAITTRLIKQVAIERKAQEKLDDLRFSVTRALPHEFRTPLNGILNLSAILRDDYDTIEPDEAIEMLEEIHISGQRLYRITQNFLLYARLKLVQKDVDRVNLLKQLQETTSTKEIIREVTIKKAKENKRENDLQLELKEATINISSSKFRKIVEEIVDNAFKFSQVNTPVKVVSHYLDKTFNLSIADRGRGMSEAQIASIGAYSQFERKVYEQQGSGLGLSIAKLLVELHGGELLIDSFPCRHTSVVIMFPDK